MTPAKGRSLSVALPMRPLNADRKLQKGSSVHSFNSGASSKLETAIYAPKKIEEHIFTILYALTDRTGRSKSFISKVLLPILILLTDFFQLLSLCVSSGWDTRTVQWIYSLFSFTEGSFTSSLGGFNIFFWISVAAIMSAVSLSLVVGHSFKTEKILVTPIKILRILVRLLVLALYIPLLKIFADNISCESATSSESGSEQRTLCSSWTWYMYTTISISMLMIFIPWAGLMALMNQDREPLSSDVEARPHGRVSLLYLMCQTVLVLAKRFLLPKYTIIFSTLIFLLTLLMFVIVVLFLPYYRLPMNKFRAGLYAGASFFALSSLVLASVGSTSSVVRLVASVLCFLAIIPVFLFGGYACTVRYNSLVVKHRMEARLLRTASLSTADAQPPRPDLLQHQRFIFPAEVEIATRFLLHDRSEDAVADAEAIFARAIQQFPASAYVQMSYATFVQVFRGEAMSSMLQFKQVAKRNPWIDLRFCLAAKRRDWEQQNQSQNLGENAMNFVAMLEFRRLYQLAKDRHNASVRLLKDFWASLIRRQRVGSSALNNVPLELEEIDNTKRDALDAYTQLLRKFPNSKVLLRSYGQFLNDMCNNPESAQVQYMKADDIEEQEPRRHADSLQLTAEFRRDPNHGDAEGNGDEGSATGSAMGGGEEDGAAGEGGEGSPRHAEYRARSISESFGNVLEGGHGDSRPHRKYKPKTNDMQAVHRLAVAVLVAFVLLGVLTAGLFSVALAMFEFYKRSLQRVGISSSQSALAIRTLHYARDLVLYAINHAQDRLDSARELLLWTASEVEAQHRGLYYGFAGGPSASANAAVKALWTNSHATFLMYIAGTPARWAESSLGLWDAGNFLVATARALASSSTSELAALQSNPRFRFLFANLDPYVHTFTNAADAYMNEVFYNTTLAMVAVSVIGASTLVLLLLLSLFVFRPAFKRVRATNKGVHDIILNLPHHMVRQLARYYGRMQLMDEEASSTAVGDEDDYDEDDDEDTMEVESPNVLRKRGASISFARHSVSFLYAPHDAEDILPGSSPRVPPSLAHTQPVPLSRSTSAHSDAEALDSVPPLRSPEIIFSPDHQQHRPDHVQPQLHTNPSPGSLRSPQRRGSGSWTAAPGVEEAAPSGPKRVDIVRQLTRQYVAAFLLIALLISVDFAVCNVFMSNGQYFATDIRHSGERKRRGWELGLLARELYIDDGLLLPKPSIMSSLIASIDALSITHASIKFGNSSLRLRGSNSRYQPQDDVLYAPRCLRLSESSCVAARFENMNAINFGLDWLIDAYTEAAYTCLQENGAFFQNGTIKSSVAAATSGADAAATLYAIDNITAASPALRLILYAAQNDLQDGLDRSLELFLVEADEQIKLVLIVAAAICAVILLVLLALYVLVFREMIKRLTAECNRTIQLLNMIPGEVVALVPFLAQYMTAADTPHDALSPSILSPLPLSSPRSASSSIMSPSPPTPREKVP